MIDLSNMLIKLVSDLEKHLVLVTSVNNNDV